MTTVLQILKFAVAMAAQADAYGGELNQLENLATGKNASRDAFLEKIEELNGPAIENLKRGNGYFVSALWDAVTMSEAPTDWTIDGLQLVMTDLRDLRMIQQPKTGTHRDEAWLMVFETIFATPDFDVLIKVKKFYEIPPDYFVLAIATGQGERASRWWYSTSEKHRESFLACLKDNNRQLRFLRVALNPENIEASEIDAKSRLPIVQAYIAHPFYHYIQPFNSSSLMQLINSKCLTAEEVLAEPDVWVALHFRQGLAYLDISRISRKAGQFPEALAALNKGMTTRLQFKNRLCHYLLERAQVYRDAGNMEAARRSLAAVNVKHLDDHNHKLFDEIEDSLESNE